MGFGLLIHALLPPKRGPRVTYFLLNGSAAGLGFRLPEMLDIMKFRVTNQEQY
jgi:hypothetical protein